MEKKKLNWGGKREGSGRKEKKDKKITKSFVLSPELAEKIEKEANIKYTSVSKTVEKIISEYFKNKKE